MNKDSKVLNYIDTYKIVRIEQLSKAFGISESTARRVLARLEKSNRIIRFHGGASSADKGPDCGLNSRFHKNMREKDAIASSAAKMTEPGSTIILLGGTTVAAMCGHIAGTGLTVITNSTLVLDRLKYDASTRLILLGGEYSPEEGEMHGSITINAMGFLNADCLFTSVTAFDAERGFFTSHLNAINFYRQCFGAAKKVYVLADSSKYLKQDIAVIARNEDVDCLVSDYALPEEAKKRFLDKGVNVLTV